MNRKLRTLVYLALAFYATHVLFLYLPPSLSWAGFWVGLVLGALATMASILVSDHAEGGPRP